MKKTANAFSRGSHKRRQAWTIREWGSLSSVIGTIVLLWLTFGPRNHANGSAEQLTGGRS